MRVRKKINLKVDLHFWVFTQLNNLMRWEITPSDIKILSELYNLDFEMANTGNVKEPKDRMAILFSSETKKQIMEKLNMSYNTFNNSLSKLRKKGIINSDNTLNENRLLKLDRDDFSFTIMFENEQK